MRASRIVSDLQEEPVFHQSNPARRAQGQTHPIDLFSCAISIDSQYFRLLWQLYLLLQKVGHLMGGIVHYMRSNGFF
jgi:hypothetical protein